MAEIIFSPHDRMQLILGRFCDNSLLSCLFFTISCRFFFLKEQEAHSYWRRKRGAVLPFSYLALSPDLAPWFYNPYPVLTVLLSCLWDLISSPQSWTAKERRKTCLSTRKLVTHIQTHTSTWNITNLDFILTKHLLFLWFTTSSAAFYPNNLISRIKGVRGWK